MEHGQTLLIHVLSKGMLAEMHTEPLDRVMLECQKTILGLFDVQNCGFFFFLFILFSDFLLFVYVCLYTEAVTDAAGKNCINT